jgi:hypothetical protein
VRLRVRLESQLNQVIQGMAVMQQNMTVMQQNMATKQDLAGSIPLFKIPKKKIIPIATALDLAYADIIICKNNKKWDAPDLALVQQTVSDIRTDISILGERIGSLELTTNIEVRESIRNQRFMINNTNYELANQERASARLQSRVERLEDITHSDRVETPLDEI